jgi:hypothetical protein
MSCRRLMSTSRGSGPCSGSEARAGVLRHRPALLLPLPPLNCLDRAARRAAPANRPVRRACCARAHRQQRPLRHGLWRLRACVRRRARGGLPPRSLRVLVTSGARSSQSVTRSTATSVVGSRPAWAIDDADVRCQWLVDVDRLVKRGTHLADANTLKRAPAAWRLEALSHRLANGARPI